MEGNGDIWVLMETSRDGAVKDVSLELLRAGRGLADQMGCALVGVVIGSEADGATRAAGLYGADRVLVAEGPEYELYTTDAYVYAMSAIATAHEPAAILIGATGRGRDLAPRLACRLKTGLTADCSRLDFDVDSSCIAWTRPALGGNLLATIICPECRPQMGTVRSGIYEKGEPDVSREVIVTRERIHVPARQIRTAVLRIVKRETDAAAQLTAARIVVAGGQGMGGSEGFLLLRELAGRLGAAVGASRLAVEAGWAPWECQIGQTGAAVRPDLYIACGISGAVQHLVGIAGSGTVIAINRDPQAPIFRAADFGLVGDVREILSKLINRLDSTAKNNG